MPGAVVQSQPCTLFARYIPGADGAPPDHRHCLLNAGIRPVTCSITARGGESFITAILDSLPEGEVPIAVHATSESGYSADVLNFLLLVNCRNQPPKAATESIVVARPGWPVTLDGGRSYDPDGEPLRECHWDVLDAPAEVLLESDESFYPKFVPSLGTTRLALTVSDGVSWSQPDTVQIICYGPELQPTHFTLEPDSIADRPAIIRSVSVAGTWNGWRVGRDTLSVRADGSWEAWLQVEPGIHEFQFVLNDSHWVSNPGGEDGANYTIRVPPFGDPPPILELSRPNWDVWQLRVASEEDKSWKLVGTGDQFQTLSVAAGEPISIPQQTTAVMKAVLIPADRGSRRQPCYIMSSNGHEKEGALSCINMPPRWIDSAAICCLDQEPFSDVTAKLSALADIGFTALWVPPVFAGPAPHGYAPTDLFAIRPSLGSKDDFAHLVQAAHGLGLKIILDFVANHTSDQDPRFRSARNRESVWHDWYLWEDGGQPAHWFDWDQLVNLNLRHPSVRHHLAAAAAYWQEFEIDGYRLDVAWAIPVEFVRHLKEYTRSKNGDFLLLGEVIPREPRYHYNGLDVSYDTDFYGMILDLLRNTKTTADVPEFWHRVSSRYPQYAVGLTYLENPDTPFLRSCFSSEQCEVASLILFTWPGVPMVRDPLAAAPDSTIRATLLSDLLALRASYPALRSRSIHWLDATSGVLAYARPGEPPCLVVVNLSDKQHRAELDTSSLSNGRNLLWKTILHVGSLPAFTQKGEHITVHCPPGSGSVFVPDE